MEEILAFYQEQRKKIITESLGEKNVYFGQLKLSTGKDDQTPGLTETSQYLNSATAKQKMKKDIDYNPQ